MEEFHRELIDKLTDKMSLGIIRSLFQTHLEGRAVEKSHIVPARNSSSGWMWRISIPGSSELLHPSPVYADSGSFSIRFWAR